MRNIRKNRAAFAACASVIEQLEMRSLLSAVLTDGTLTITGTDSADTIDVSFHTSVQAATTTGTYSVVDDSVDYSFPASSVAHVFISGGKGNDNIAINGTEDDSATDGVAVSFSITDGDGNDTLDSTLGETGFLQHNASAPTVLITAGNGDDSIFVEGSVGATVVAGNGEDTVFAQDTEDVMTDAVTLGNGNDLIDGLSAGNGQLTIDDSCGTGHDTFNNQNDPDIFISGAQQNEVVNSGIAYFTTPATPLVGATVYIDVNNDGKFDAGDPSTTTNALGAYTLTADLNEGDPADYKLSVIPPAAFVSTPAAITETQVPVGTGFSGQDFALDESATAETPTVIGTPGSYKNQGNTIIKTVDGNFSTFFDGPDASGDFVGFDYGSPQQITNISYAPRTGFASRMVGGIFQGSNSPDFSNASTLYTITATPVSGSLTTVSVSNTGIYRYVRYVGPANSYCNISEMRYTLLPTAGMVDGNTLVVMGTPGADAININFSLTFANGYIYGNYAVDANGITTNYWAGNILEVVVNGGDGNDTIGIVGDEINNDAASTPPVNVVVDEGDGNDTVNISIADSGFSSAAGGGGLPASTITAGNGNDTLFQQGGGAAYAAVGSGKDVLTATATNDNLFATYETSNGNDTINGSAPENGKVQINASVGTGRDKFNNSDSANVAINASTSDGQTLKISQGQTTLTGLVYVGMLSVPKSGATVFLDSNDNGVLDSGELFTITDANGHYSLTVVTPPIPNPLPFYLRVIAPGYTTVTPVREEFAGNGFGYSGEDFGLTASGSTTAPVVIGTAGSYNNQGNTAAKAVDGNLSTFFDSPIASGGYVGLDYGSPVVIKQISFAPRSGFASRMVDGLFQGSNSSAFTNVVTLYEITSSPVSGKFTTVSLSNTTAFRYIRYIGPTNSYCNIAEMQFALATKLTGTAIGTAGSYRSQGNTIANAFDGNLNTFFDAPDASGDWVGLDLGLAKIATSVSFAPRPGYTTRMVGGQFQASNSATFSTGVVTLATITTQPTAGALTTLSLNNTMAFRYYRYIGPAGSYCNISELEFDG